MLLEEVDPASPWGIGLSSQGVGSIGAGAAGQQLAPVRARVSPGLTGGEFDRFDLSHRPTRPWARRQPPRLQTSDGVSLGLESTTPSFAPKSPRPASIRSIGLRRNDRQRDGGRPAQSLAVRPAKRCRIPTIGLKLAYQYNKHKIVDIR